MRFGPFSLKAWIVCALVCVSGFSSVLAVVLTAHWQASGNARSVASGFGTEMATLVIAAKSGSMPMTLGQSGAGALHWRMVTGNKFDEPTRRNWSETLFRLPSGPSPESPPILARVFLEKSALDATMTPPGQTLAEQFSYLSGRVAALSTLGAIRVQVSQSDWIEFTSPMVWTARSTKVQLALLASLGVLGLFGLISFLSAFLTRSFGGLSDYAASILGKTRPAYLPDSIGPQEVQEISKALNQVNRDLGKNISERTRFLTAISHDLRTPVTRMQLRCELIEDEQIRTKFLSDLSEITRMISDTINFLRDGLEKEKLENTHFLTFLESICEDYVDVGKNVTFEDPEPLVIKTTGTVFDPRSKEFDVKGTRYITLFCQPNRLRRAINNLIDNALKYGDWARVRVSADAQNILLRINDGGPGLEQEQTRRVFEPFYQANAKHSHSEGGSGLGLSLAKSVIESHGGTITLFNHDRCGLEVRVTLPRAN